MKVLNDMFEMIDLISDKISEGNNIARRTQEKQLEELERLREQNAEMMRQQKQAQEKQKQEQEKQLKELEKISHGVGRSADSQLTYWDLKMLQ